MRSNKGPRDCRNIAQGRRARAPLYDLAADFYAGNHKAVSVGCDYQTSRWQAEVCRAILTSRAGVLDYSSTAQSFSSAMRSVRGFLSAPCRKVSAFTCPCLLRLAVWSSK